MASIRCVRPDFTTVENSPAFTASVPARCSSAGFRSMTTAFVAATWIADGNWSLDDSGSFTSSFGCTGEPSRSDASEASTSLAFMFEDVPEPVWNTSIGNSASQSPRTTSAATSAIAAAFASSSRPRLARTRAPAPLINASPAMSSRSIGWPEIGKFSTARWVCARHFAAAGTRTSPIESFSMRYSCSSDTNAPDSAGRMGPAYGRLRCASAGSVSRIMV